MSIFDVIVANKYYSSLMSDYEIIVHNGTKVACVNTDCPIQLSFKLQSIKAFQDLELNGLYGE